MGSSAGYCSGVPVVAPSQRKSDENVMGMFAEELRGQRRQEDYLGYGEIEERN